MYCSKLTTFFIISCIMSPCGSLKHSYMEEFDRFPTLIEKSKDQLYENDYFNTRSSLRKLENIRPTDVLEKLQSDNGLLSASNNTMKVSELCRNHTKLLIDGIFKREMWALKMFDASGKLSSGILEGNIASLGSYDECRGIEETKYADIVNQFKGKYCFVQIPMKLPVTMASEAKYFFAACIPSSCSADDVKLVLNETMEVVNGMINITLSSTDTVVCHEDPEFDSSAAVAIVILSIFGLLLTLSTTYDIVVVQLPKYRQLELVNEHSKEEKIPLLGESPPVISFEENNLGKIILSFSVYTNAMKILNTEKSAGTLTALNGIRFLSISWVVLGHSYAFNMQYYSNQVTVLPEMLRRWTFQAISNALVSVDSFFALSGLLLAYLTLKEMEKGKGKLNWMIFYFHRFWRLTPPYMLVLMINATLSAYFSDGPIWPKDGFEIDHCKTTWWTNLLYINNLVDDTKSCMGWSWYLANDMQFFILSPLMLIPLFYQEVIGLAVCCVFLLGTTIASGVISSHYELPPSMFGGGGQPSGYLHYMSYYYIKPWCRMGPYISGVIFGYLLYKTKCKVRLNKWINILLWIVFATLACLILYGLHNPINNDPLNNSVSSLYNATHKTVWGMCVCWVIFACATGNGGFINSLLSWSAFIPLARLSYCVYLVHPIIMYTYIYSQRSTHALTDLYGIYMFLGHLVLSYLAAFVASLSFEAPMMGLEKVLLRRGTRSKS